MNEQPVLKPYEAPEQRYGSVGEWWALGKLESTVQNPDGSVRTFSVEVGVSLTPHGDYLHCEDEFWQLVAKRLPEIARQLRPRR